MTLRQRDIRIAASQYRGQISLSLAEATRASVQTAFLCHSHKDRDLVDGLITLLRSGGWQVYVDWADTDMPEVPDERTADIIRHRIVSTGWFLFLATANSMASRWCPWEIGYADGRKPIDRILIIPTEDGVNTHGSEYLKLYRRIIPADNGQLAAFFPNNRGIYLRDLT